MVGNLCDPEWYGFEDAAKVYKEHWALTGRYRKEHPFSAGSPLKSCFPGVSHVSWFTGDFSEKYIVLKAYDRFKNRKYLLIRFTVDDEYFLDTVTVRELSDEEVQD